MFNWANNISKNVEWSRAKGLIVDGPSIFGYHFVYIDSNYKVAIILPKADKTLHIFIGDPVKADRWIKFDSNGKMLFDKPLSGYKYEWKINKRNVRYRGFAPGFSKKGVVYKYSDFSDEINDEWIENKKIKLYQVYNGDGILPLTTNW